MTAKKRKSPASTAGLDIEKVCAAVIDGTMLTRIAESVGLSKSALLSWIDSDDVRSARVREARNQAAGSWDERAEQVIEDAGDPFSLAKARELAQHYRWRASKIGHKVYGDKLDLKHSGGVSVVPVTPTDEAL